MDTALDEKELMELMQELQKVKEENLEMINNIIDNPQLSKGDQQNSVVKQQDLQNFNSGLKINTISNTLNNNPNEVNISNNVSNVSDYPKFSYDLERKLVNLFNQLISLVNNEFLLIKKENERNLKFQKVFAKTLTTLINQSKVNLNELKGVKDELSIIKQNLEEDKKIQALLLKELGSIKASLDNLNKILSEQTLEEKEIKEKIIKLLEINKKVNEDLAEKIIKLEKELLLLIEGIEEMKVYLKLSDKLDNIK